MSLATPLRVRRLGEKLHAKAKAEPCFRFYSLWDKVCDAETLSAAYARCRANRGAAGVDAQRFDDIEAHGLERWLGNLQQELRTGQYRPSPLLRAWIPKSNGKMRPLSIPTVRDRVVQTAVLLVVEPIFEADLLPEQYGFRQGVDAKMAVRRVFFHVSQRKLTQVVDGDLSDYFATVPHGSLMKCVARRISDGRILGVIRAWLRAPVEERATADGRSVRQHAAMHRGLPQGGPISPLLSNLYFRRFLLAWYQRGIAKRLGALVVNYADDFVICCRPGNGPAALEEARRVLTAMGLVINEDKTRLANLPQDRFDFLGYTFGRLYRKDGTGFIGTRPSKKAVQRIRRRIHDETTQRWTYTSPQKRVQEINAILRGWCGYFDQGPVFAQYWLLRKYTERRLRRWLMRKHRRRGTGYRQYPDEYLYETLGLYKPRAPERRPAVNEGM